MKTRSKKFLVTGQKLLMIGRLCYARCCQRASPASRISKPVPGRPSACVVFLIIRGCGDNCRRLCGACGSCTRGRNLKASVLGIKHRRKGCGARLFSIARYILDCDIVKVVFGGRHGGGAAGEATVETGEDLLTSSVI